MRGHTQTFWVKCDFCSVSYGAESKNTINEKTREWEYITIGNDSLAHQNEACKDCIQTIRTILDEFKTSRQLAAKDAHG